MKIFNTLQEFWDHSLFCPACHQNSRKIDISVGPEYIFTINSCAKFDDYLSLETNAKISYKDFNKNFDINFKINCLNNSFDYQMFEKELGISKEIPIQKGPSPYFYFYWNVSCICKNSSLASLNIELDFLNKKISKLGIDTELIYLLEQEDKYKVSINYTLETMNISRFYPGENDNYSLGSSFNCPISKIDFSNLQKAVSRIRMILLFN